MIGGFLCPVECYHLMIHLGRIRNYSQEGLYQFLMILDSEIAMTPKSIFADRMRC